MAQLITDEHGRIPRIVLTSGTMRDQLTGQETTIDRSMQEQGREAWHAHLRRAWWRLKTERRA